MSRTLLLSAAEASADALGAELARVLLARRPDLSLEGIAGPRMREAGVKALFPAESLGVMGLAELWSAWRNIRSARRALRESLDRRPALFIPIDAPDLHLPLLPRAKGLGVRSLLLGSPQVWAWRRGRARSIATLCHEVLCLLPFEPTIYTALGGRATWIGHPAVDRAPPSKPGVDWAILPGSRRAELRRLLPDMLAAARLVRQAHPQAVLRLGLASGLTREDLEQAGADLGGIELVQGLRAAAEPAGACLVASGTATLELLAMGRPMVVCARVHPLTYWVGRALVRGISHVSLPNILAGRELVPEHLQHFSPQDLARDWMEQASRGLSPALESLRAQLGPPGVAERAADRVLAALEAA